MTPHAPAYRRGVNTQSLARAKTSTRARFCCFANTTLKRRYLRIGSTQQCREHHSPCSARKLSGPTVGFKSVSHSSKSSSRQLKTKNSKEWKLSSSALSMPEKSAESLMCYARPISSGRKPIMWLSKRKCRLSAAPSTLGWRNLTSL